jgi:dTDP-4-amino-4,6-dideoxygalactose transaminase
VEEERLLAVLRSGVWGGYSPAVKEFEDRFAAYLGAAHCVTMANGTVSLEVALRCEGVGPGDEVIVPPYTFTATASAVSQVGAVPVFADVQADTLNLDPARFEAAITERTRAVIPVHFAGQAANMDAILEIARRHRLIVIEDAAHAHGGRHRAGMLGALGEWGSFSFQQSKIMTAGEGGCLVTSDPVRAAKARAYCNQGRREGGAWYDHYTLGTNLRMTGFQAAVLLAQLDRLEAEAARRVVNAAILRRELARMPALSPLAPAGYCERHAGALFLMRFDKDQAGMSKSAFEEALRVKGVAVMQTYPRPVYGNPLYEQLPFRDTGCPVAEQACREIVTLPLSLLNGSEAEIAAAVAGIRAVLQNGG